MRDRFSKSIHIKFLITAVSLIGLAGSAYAGLTADEIQQIESEFGITLTAEEIQKLEAVVYPSTSPQWRMDAEARIEQYRKANLDLQVVDAVGNPVKDAQVHIKMRSNAFKFGGTFAAKDFSGVTNTDKIDTDVYKSRLLSMFNSVGLNNGFKPRLTGIHSYVPGVLDWAQANDLPVRGHLLMWPGIGDLEDLDDPTAVVGVDYGTHLSSSSTSGFASYDVRGAVEVYRASSRAQADKDALEAVVHAEILEWVSQWDVYEWDVINETLGNHLLQDILGQDQMAEWFNIAAANKVSADTKLVLNDYQIITAMSEGLRPGHYDDRKADYMTNIDRIIADGGLLDRIGFQSRVKFEHKDPQSIYDRLEEWGSAYGLEMVGTEFEVVDGTNPNWYPYVYTEEERSQITEEMMTQYFSHPLVAGLSAWATIHDENKALVDFSGHPNANGLVWYYMHRIRYTTDITGISDATGSAGAQAFKGEYDVMVSYNGSDYPVSFNLSSNQTVVVELGDVVVEPGPVPQPTWVVLENWNYDAVQVDGTSLTNGLSTTESGLYWANKTPFGVVSNQMQRWEATGLVNESGFNDIRNPPYQNATAGRYQLSYDVVSADFSQTDAIGGKAQFGYGIRDATLTGGDRNGVVLVRYEDTGGVNKFRLSVSAGATVQQDIASGNSISNLHVRAVYDLDEAGSAGSFIGYFSIGDGPETAVTNALASGFTLKTLRMHIQALNGGNSWQAGDVVTIDNLTFSEEQLIITSDAYYAHWMSEYPNLGSQTNLTDNPDADIADNLLEYAFGGDPTSGQDIGYWPTFQTLEDGGTNYIEYVYTKRNDAEARGLGYQLETNPDLIGGTWTNSGFVLVGEGAVNGEFNAVTNRVPTLGNAGFIRVNVGFAP